MKIIDLSTTMSYDPNRDPASGIENVKIEFYPHSIGFGYFVKTYFPGLEADQVPNGGFNAFDMVGPLSTHDGTHMDAPLHYNPKMNGDEDSWSIDEIPVEWFYGDGVVLDFSDKPSEFLIEPEHIKAELERINYALKPGDIVLIRTNGPQYYGTPEYQINGCGMSKAATLFLSKENGIRVMGTDSYGWDRPFVIMSEEWKKDGDPSIVWQGHLAGVEQAYCHIEKLWNLDKLPPHGFKVVAAPVKLKGCTAAWVRPLAIIED